jgi:hypothetical protein
MKRWLGGFVTILFILLSTTNVQAGQQALEAIAFQDVEDNDVPFSPAVFLDTTTAVSAVDDLWSPTDVTPYGAVTKDYYDNGKSGGVLDAISLEFDPAGLDITRLKLRVYLQKGECANEYREHYQLLPGKFNPHNEDNGGSGPGLFPSDVTRHDPDGINLAANTVVGWVEFPFNAASDSDYTLPDGNIALTLRLWNWRVDAVELVEGSGPIETPALGLYGLLPPCRIFDTRDILGPTSGNPLHDNTIEAFVVQGICGIPVGAKAILANVTAVSPTGQGHLRVFSSAVDLPLVSTLNFPGGNGALANGAIIFLADQSLEPEDLSVFARVVGSGTVHMIVDVTGYLK